MTDARANYLLALSLFAALQEMAPAVEGSEKVTPDSVATLFALMGINRVKAMNESERTELAFNLERVLQSVLLTA